MQLVLPVKEEKARTEFSSRQIGFSRALAAKTPLGRPPL